MLCVWALPAPSQADRGAGADAVKEELTEGEDKGRDNLAWGLDCSEEELLSDGQECSEDDDGNGAGGSDTPRRSLAAQSPAGAVRSQAAVVCVLCKKQASEAAQLAMLAEAVCFRVSFAAPPAWLCSASDCRQPKRL